MSLCVHNIGCLVTCVSKKGKTDREVEDILGRHYNASILFKDGKVTFLGSAADCPIDSADIVIDGRGLIALPGLVDCHTHSVWAGSRANEFAERLRGTKYEDILSRGGGINSTMRATRQASFDQLYTSCRERVGKLCDFGCTTVEIKSGYGLNVDAETKMMRVIDRIKQEGDKPHLATESHPPSSCEPPIVMQPPIPRVVRTFLGAHLVPFEFKDDREGYIKQLVNEQLPVVKEYSDHIDIFIDRGAFTLEEGMQVLDAGKRHGLKVKAHAEQLAHTGCAKLVADLGGLSADHLERIDEAGCKAMADKDVVAVLLPGAQFYLKDIPPPTAMLRDYKVKMAVSTDLNPGSSPVYDLLQCATMCCILQGLSVEESILGITKNAGLALGRSELGWLGKGSAADLALFTPPPGEGCNVESLIQFSGGYECIGSVKDAEIFVDNGLNLINESGGSPSKRIKMSSSRL